MKRLALLAMLIPVSAVGEESGVALAHPPFQSFYSCTEHFAGQLQSPGDALGTDCIVQRLIEVNGREWLRAYEKEGQENEHWYGWHENVIAPCDCEVVKVQENPKDNRPGQLGAPPAGYVILKRTDGVHFMVAHIRSITLREGEKTKQGQPIAKVGNNGYSRHPHIHMGAWKGEQAMQIRFDQTKMTLPPELRASEAQQGVPADGPRPAGSARR